MMNRREWTKRTAALAAGAALPAARAAESPSSAPAASAASAALADIAQFAKDGTKPKPTEGKSFFDTGVNLVTDKPANGVKSIDTKEGTDKCWG